MEKIRAVVYCRVAHQDQLSLQAQADLLQWYANKAGYTIVYIVSETGSAAALDRPGLQKVTQAVMDGKADLVLVRSISRIGRAFGLTKQYIDLLNEHKVSLLCVKESLYFTA